MNYKRCFPKKKNFQDKQSTLNTVRTSSSLNTVLCKQDCVNLKRLKVLHNTQWYVMSKQLLGCRHRVMSSTLCISHSLTTQGPVRDHELVPRSLTHACCLQGVICVVYLCIMLMSGQHLLRLGVWLALPLYTRQMGFMCLKCSSTS